VKRRSQLLLLLILIFLFGLNIHGQENTDKLKLNADFRFRAERDWNSLKTDGSKRDDRDRLRYRLRFGFNYAINNNLEFGGRIRSGNPLNQQSPHITLGKEFQSDDFSIDKAFLKVLLKNGYWAWVGKNGLPFWEQNELLWDGDVNPEGIALGKKFMLNGKSSLEPVFGYFIARHSGKSFSNDSRITIAQLKLNSHLHNNNIIISSGGIRGKDLPDKPDGTQTFDLNYTIWATSLQFIHKNSRLQVGIDFFKNLSGYDTSSQIDEVYKDQTSGYVGSLLYNLKRFQFSYYYAYIEKYAVIDYLAQDDWVRWGNSNFTRASNFKGHEFRLKYNFNKQFNTVLRTYIVKAIKTTGSHLETGTRVRLDLNIKL
jgi:hypothetical protein